MYEILIDISLNALHFEHIHNINEKVIVKVGNFSFTE